MINWLIEKLPGFIRWPITLCTLMAYIIYKIFLFGYEAPIRANAWFDQRWDARAAPHMRYMDQQFHGLEKDIREIKQDTRDIRNHLLGDK